MGKSFQENVNSFPDTAVGHVGMKEIAYQLVTVGI